jgi:hypothetical protein
MTRKFLKQKVNIPTTTLLKISISINKPLMVMGLMGLIIMGSDPCLGLEA